MLAQLRHPAIVAVYDIGEVTPGVPYLAMEWVEGSTLSQLLRSRRMFSLQEVLGVLEPLCSALAAAHEIGMIHRDIKPSNLLLNSDCHIKVKCFGNYQSIICVQGL
jgi:serine/threonine-protein kinase